MSQHGQCDKIRQERWARVRPHQALKALSGAVVFKGESDGQLLRNCLQRGNVRRSIVLEDCRGQKWDKSVGGLTIEQKLIRLG